MIVGPRRASDEEGADDRGDDADAADRQRIDIMRRHRDRPAKKIAASTMVATVGHRVGLEQVGGHAGAVADVVADVVGDGGRVARIIFGMPASTLPTRSPPTSAPLVKMPPPRRAKIEISEAPKPSATSASKAARL
jgi:hypothetical protein